MSIRLATVYCGVIDTNNWYNIINFVALCCSQVSMADELLQRIMKNSDSIGHVLNNEVITILDNDGVISRFDASFT